jgi:hypothetical protein
MKYAVEMGSSVMIKEVHTKFNKVLFSHSNVKGVGVEIVNLI